MLRGMLAGMAVLAALTAGCGKTELDPITGTWEGTLILKDVNQQEDTSALRLVLTRNDYTVSGSVTAAGFNWHSAPITAGVYAEGTEEFGLSANVGGDDVSLMLAGSHAGTRLSGDAATGAALPRYGTWEVTKK